MLAILAAVDVKPAFFTDSVSKDADDPAVWVNRRDPAKSVIFGTNKTKAPKGAIVAFDLNGKTLQTVDGLDRPNNCDVEYGVGGMDVLVTTERLKNRLRIFRIGRHGKLKDVTGTTACVAEPMGISLYKKNGEALAIVSPKTGPSTGYLAAYRLKVRKGKVDATLVRRFGAYSGRKEIESIAVDDELGYVYYSDERFGTRKVSLSSFREVALFNTAGFKADHEGIALWTRPGGGGYLVCTDQIQGNSEYHVYTRKGNKPVGVFRVGADETDGIEVTSASLGSKFPKGIFVAMDSGPKRFAVASWADVARKLGLP